MTSLFANKSLTKSKSTQYTEQVVVVDSIDCLALIQQGDDSTRLGCLSEIDGRLVS